MLAPLLVLDMYEHAYQAEFGANATAYVDAFLRNVDWPSVANRLKQATDRPVPVEKAIADGITVEELTARRAVGESIQIIDEIGPGEVRLIRSDDGTCHDVVSTRLR